MKLPRSILVTFYMVHIWDQSFFVFVFLIWHIIVLTNLSSPLNCFLHLENQWTAICVGLYLNTILYHVSICLSQSKYHRVMFSVAFNKSEVNSNFFLLFLLYLLVVVDLLLSHIILGSSCQFLLKTKSLLGSTLRDCSEYIDQLGEKWHLNTESSPKLYTSPSI